MGKNEVKNIAITQASKIQSNQNIIQIERLIWSHLDRTSDPELNIDRTSNDQIVTDVIKAIELKPSCALLYNNRGDVQAELGKYNEAIADYTKAIQLRSEFDLAINNQKMLMDKINCGK
uniref:Tetratricopeptide repeat protein n=1 Tax=Acrobeloides nanus TaxID=290746 RepID=A0A914D0B0_9BILA